MKRLFAVLFTALLLCCIAAGCADIPQTEPPAQGGSGAGAGVPEQSDGTEQEEVTQMFITIDGNKVKVTLAQNSSVDALLEILKQGDIVYTADDYGDFEKVGGLGHTLPSSDTQITTQAGDVILYSRNQIVLFYGSNKWSYTRLGKIEGYSEAELRTLLGAGRGKVQVTLSLN